MPELPEVETVVRGLARRIVGQQVEHVHLLRGDILHGEMVPLCAALRRQRVKQVFRRGKQIWIELASGRHLVIHLGMTGRCLAVDGDMPPEPHTHLRVTFQGCRLEMRFIDPRRFGGIWLIVTGTTDRAYWLGRNLPAVGPDPLELSFAAFRSALSRRRQIKPLLLDQEAVSGMGNIYCDEALHRAGIHPLTIASQLSEARFRALYRAARAVLRAAIRAGGTSISDYRNADNTSGWFQRRLRAYGREGKKCHSCGGAIVRTVVGGRGTFYCPRCQRRR